MTVPLTNMERLGRNLDGISRAKYVQAYPSPKTSIATKLPGTIVSVNGLGQLSGERRYLPPVDRGIAVSAGTMLSSRGYEGTECEQKWGFDTVWDFIRYLFGYRKYYTTCTPQKDTGMYPYQSWIANYSGFGIDDPYMMSRWADRRIDKPISPFYERKARNV